MNFFLFSYSSFQLCYVTTHSNSSSYKVPRWKLRIVGHLFHPTTVIPSRIESSSLHAGNLVAGNFAPITSIFVGLDDRNAPLFQIVYEHGLFACQIDRDNRHRHNVFFWNLELRPRCHCLDENLPFRLESWQQLQAMVEVDALELEEDTVSGGITACLSSVRWRFGFLSCKLLMELSVSVSFERDRLLVAFSLLVLSAVAENDATLLGGFLFLARSTCSLVYKLWQSRTISHMVKHTVGWSTLKALQDLHIGQSIHILSFFGDFAIRIFSMQSLQITWAQSLNCIGNRSLFRLLEGSWE